MCAVRTDLETELKENVTNLQTNVTKQFNYVYDKIDSDYTEIQQQLIEVQNNVTKLKVTPLGNLFSCANVLNRMSQKRRLGTCLMVLLF